MANTRVTPCQVQPQSRTLGTKGVWPQCPPTSHHWLLSSSSNLVECLWASHKAPSGLSFPQRPGKSGLDGLSHLPTSRDSRHFRNLHLGFPY